MTHLHALLSLPGIAGVEFAIDTFTDQARSWRIY